MLRGSSLGRQSMGPADVYLTFGEIAPKLERVAPELEGVNSS